MSPTQSATVLAVLGVVVLAAMLAGWRHRVTRSVAVVPELLPAPAADDPALGAALTAPIDATYVSTTRASDWLDRVAAHGLGARSGAVVRVYDAGVLIERTGAPDLYLPAATVRAVGTSAGIAGKVVGHDGLIVLTWQAPGSAGVPGIELTTGLRLRHAADRPLLIEAAGALAGPAPEAHLTRADDLGAGTEGAQ
ncbi:hypothetical protein [Pengzhenrongella frigida]|uniref:PH-like domain-containing protein n=1 Tax=Pengzhenrongella frigida TaxID=1259133 RepID=UPI001A930068|nr:hypothetical protein [Cellulomonas sp. HLT2-17]